MKRRQALIDFANALATEQSLSIENTLTDAMIDMAENGSGAQIDYFVDLLKGMLKRLDAGLK